MSPLPSHTPASDDSQPKYLPAGNDPDFYFPMHKRRRSGIWYTLRSLFQRKR